MREFTQGIELKSDESDFEAGLRAVVDYRGDVTINLNNGTLLEGFIYSVDNNYLHYYPKSGNPSEKISRSDVRAIQISGEDTAAGKSWGDWVKRRESERAKSQNKSKA